MTKTNRLTVYGDDVMETWRNALIRPSTLVLDAIQMIDNAGLQIALVVDEESRLLGTVTDGDVRRGILRGVMLDEPVSVIMNSTPTVARLHDTHQSILAMMKIKRIHHVPVVDSSGQIVNVHTLAGLISSEEHANWVVLMAGGMGTRLRPLTDDCPKPLLKVGDKPLMETIVQNFCEFGFSKFYISVNYKSQMIMEHFGDGAKLGVEIRYLHEDKQLGTAGSLAMLPKDIQKPVIVMNGDLLTKVNFKQLLDFHVQQKALATMCVREYNFQIPYGVVQTEGHKLLGIEEKPIHSCFVNAGIYVFDPDVLDLIPRDTFFDMPNLFEKLKALECETVVFPIHEYWMDIGQRADFDRANVEFAEVFR